MLTPPEVWSTYDPDAGEFNEEVLKRWSEKGIDYKEAYFSAYINGQTVRVYGIYAAPAGTEKSGVRIPAVMHLHGGGQTVNQQWLEDWPARGYAILSCNYHGVWDNRERYTIYPEVIKQGNHKFFAGKEMATTPTVRESSWYIWSAVARRALSYVRRQPGVDPDRIGAFGISMGGTTIWSFALDPRLKAACAIYGCGWNRYYRYTPRYAPAGKMPPMTEDDRVWITGMSPEGCAPYVKCPILFLSGSNDSHGNMDRAYQTMERMPANVESRQAFTPRYCHHIGADFDHDLFLWMDTWLKGGPAWPKSPVVKIALGTDGVPMVTLTPDKPADVESVAIYYAVENHRVVNRNWRNATAVRTGDSWQARLPVMDVKAYLFAYANVRYKSKVHLSSNEDAVIPATLGAARATDAASTVIYDGSDGTGMWFSSSPCTDPVPLGQIYVPLWATTAPAGPAGFAMKSFASPITHQPGDPKWRAPAGASLRFTLVTKTGEDFRVMLYKDYSWPGQRHWEAKVSIKGEPGSQTVTLAPADFKEGGDGNAPVDFAMCDTLQLCGPWKDEGIVFTGVEWVTN